MLTLLRLVHYARVPIGIVAIIGLVLSAYVQLAALRGIDVETSWPSVWVLHYALIPIIAFAVVAAVATTGKMRLTLREFLALVPSWAKVILASALLYAVACFVLVTPETAAGDPVIRDGHFFFNNHGTISEVSEAEFHHARSLTLRLFSSFWLYLYLFAALYLLCAWPREPLSAVKS
jgi:hypothetical protein